MPGTVPGMTAASFIVSILSRVAPLLLHALQRRWDGDKLRQELGNLVNDAELERAQATADQVDKYLAGG